MSGYVYDKIYASLKTIIESDLSQTVSALRPDECNGVFTEECAISGATTDCNIEVNPENLYICLSYYSNLYISSFYDVSLGGLYLDYGSCSGYC